MKNADTAGVFEAALHHEVLAHWAEYRRKSGIAPGVLSLDFHTDTLSCTGRGIPPPEPGIWQNPAKTAEAMALLHHDEHFDWALRAGVISRAVLVTIAPQRGKYGCAGMLVRSFPESVAMETLLNDPGKARCFADCVLTDKFLQPVTKDLDFERTPWILDIDCDVFLTERAIEFEDVSCFSRLVRNAVLVTLSGESDWVKILRLPGEEITGEILVQTLLKRCRNLRKKRE